MKLYSCLLLILTAVVVVPLKAATYTFDTATDYTGNFTAAFNSGANALTWSNTNPFGNHVAKYDPTTASSTYSILNSPAASTSYTLKADVVFNGPIIATSPSFGFLTNIGTNNGYVAIFRLTGTTTADFRVFEGVNASTGTVGTEVNNQTFTLSSGTWSSTTYYTLKLDVLNTGSAISFTGSMLTTGGSSLATFSTYTETSPLNSASNTSVGFRMGVNADTAVRMDNFSLTAIPEPSTYALLGGAGMLGLALCTRRKRA